MKFLRKDIISQNDLVTNIIILFIAFAIGFGISSNLFSPWQMLVIACGFLILIIIFNKPDIIALLVITLMFIPLQLGSIFGINFKWLADPLIIILLFSSVMKYLKRGTPFLSRAKNPFLIPVALYFAVWLFNYFRNPLPPTSLLGLPSEMGGFRYYYENFLLLILFLSFSYLVATIDSFAQRAMKIVLWMSGIVTIIGLLILFVKPIDNAINNLQEVGIFHSRPMLTGSWNKRIDPVAGAIRSDALWGPPSLGILLLISGVVNIKKSCMTVLLLIFCLGLIFSASRSFFLGTLAALFFWVIWQGKKKIVPFIIIAGIFYLVFINYDLGVLGHQFDRLFMLKGKMPELLTGRAPLFSIYWESFKRHPLFGVGVGATEIGMAIPGSYEYFMLHQLRYGGHSLFLGTLYTMGLAALIPFLWILRVGIYIAFKLLKIKENNSSSIAVFCLLFLLYCIIPFSIGGGETYNLLFIIVGILSGLYIKYNCMGAK